MVTLRPQQPRPWQQLLYKYFPELDGKEPNDDGWVTVRCPLHTDTKGSAGVNVESGRFTCHNPTCRESYTQQVNRPPKSTIRSLSLAELLTLWQGWSESDARQVVEGYRTAHLDDLFAHDDAVTADGAKKQSTLNFFSVEVADFVRKAARDLDEQFNDLEMVIDYAYSRGIAKTTLVQAGIGFVPPGTKLPDNTTSGAHGCMLFPYWFKDRLVGVRIRQADSRKRMLINSHYVPYGINNVFDTTSRTLVVGEGESDTLRLAQALAQMGMENVPVIGTPGDNFDRTWTRFLRRFNRIICVPQADEASQKDFVGSLKRSVDSRLEVVQIPWEEDALGGKDVCDFLLMHDNNTQALVSLLSVSEFDTFERPYIKTWDYFAHLPEREIDWMIPGVIERGSKALIVGDPKVGKTFMVLDLLRSVIHGTPFMGNPQWAPTDAGLRCLLIEEEGSERALARRILSIIEPTDKLGVIHGENVKLDDPLSFGRLRQAVTSYRPDLVVFDPYASLHNQDENEVQGTMLVVDAINTIYRAVPGCTVVILHHSTIGTKRARGSGSLWGAVDYKIQAYRNAPGNIGIEIAGREVEESEPMFFDFDSETLSFSPMVMTKIKVISHKKIDDTLRQHVENVLRAAKTGLTQGSIMDTLHAQGIDADYMPVRLVLKAMTDASLVTKSGNAGRNGYTYTWDAQ